jgi:hypothetical protein
VLGRDVVDGARVEVVGGTVVSGIVVGAVVGGTVTTGISAGTVVRMVETVETVETVVAGAVLMGRVAPGVRLQL